MGILDNLRGKKSGETKTKPDFSDVRSSSSSTAQPSSTPSPTSGATPPTSGATPVGNTYTVAKGDSLSEIAQRVYGDAQKWRVIYEANRDVIQDPDVIQPGQTLRLPSA